jgi:hypothetical protein
MAKEMLRLKEQESSLVQELKLKNDVLELNVKHLNERILLNEEDIKQKESTIKDLAKETVDLQSQLRMVEESNLTLKS